MTGSITRIPALVKSAVKVYKPLNGSWLVVSWKKGDDYSKDDVQSANRCNLCGP